MSLKGIAAGFRNLKSVNFIQYFHTKQINSDLSELHTVVVKLNATTYIGKYVAATQEEAYDKAKDVVMGFLVKCGCNNPETRILDIPYREYNFEAVGPPPTDITPDALDWGDISYLDAFGSYGTYTQQVTGINTPITLLLTNQSNSNINVWYKTSSTGVVGASNEISTTGYILLNNGLFNVDPNYYVTFLAAPSDGWRGAPTNVTVSLLNTTDSNTLLDTFTVSVSPF